MISRCFHKAGLKTNNGLWEQNTDPVIKYVLQGGGGGGGGGGDQYKHAILPV